MPTSTIIGVGVVLLLSLATLALCVWARRGDSSLPRTPEEMVRLYVERYTSAAREALGRPNERNADRRDGSKQ